MLEALKVLGPTLGTVIAAYFAYRVGMKKATDEGAASKITAVAAEAATKLTAVATLTAASTAEDETAVKGWQALASEYRSQFEVLTAKLTTLEVKIESMQEKIISLEAERDQHRFWRRISADYIKSLLAVLASHNIVAPVPPAGLRMDLEANDPNPPMEPAT